VRSEAARELSLGVLALASSLVLMALVAINVLERMTPAVERMMNENVGSMSAASRMFAALAAARLPEPAGEGARERFFETLAWAVKNGTEPGELEVLEELRVHGPAALDGDRRSLELALTAISRLESINDSAAQVAQADIERLARGGEWALALLGIVGFAAGAYVRGRLYRRVVSPLHELERVLLSVEGGDELQRCASRGHSPQQHQALRSLNRLLDSARAQANHGGTTDGLPRDLVPGLLDAWEGPVALVDAQGELMSASRTMLDRLANDDGLRLRQAMRRVAHGMTDEHVHKVREGEGWVLVRCPPEAPAAPNG
jgi:hypothetical protein